MTSVKKGVKKQFLRRRILSLIQEGNSTTNICEKMGMSRQSLYYWTKKLRDEDLISKVKGTSPAFFEITDKCKKEMIGYHFPDQYHVDLHNYQIKYPILKEGNMPVESTWVSKGTLFKEWTHNNCKVRASGSADTGEMRTLTISIRNEIGKSAEETKVKSMFKMFQLAKHLENYSGFKLGIPEQSRKEHIAVVNPVAKKFADNIQLSTEIYDINKSQSGEIEFDNPKHADDFIRGSIRSGQQIKKLNEKMDSMMEIMKKTILALGQSNQETISATKKADRTIDDIRERFDLDE